MDPTSPPYRTSPLLQCGKCGVQLQPKDADLSAEGYRCLSCSTDDRIAANVAEDARDAARIWALKKLRIALFLGLLLFGAFALGAFILYGASYALTQKPNSEQVLLRWSEPWTPVECSDLAG